MAIETFASLKSAVQTYAVRPDIVFGNMVPTFIELAEARLYDGAGEPGEDIYSPPLRSSAMEVTDSVAMTSGVGTMPTNALEIRKVYVEDQRWGVSYVQPERFAELDENASAGTPRYYTVEAGTIKTTPGFTGNILLTYFRRYDAITSSNTSGPLLTAHGTIYLEACLFEAFSFLQEIPLAVGHLAKLKSLIQGANRTASSLRYPGPVRVRSRMAFP